MTSQEAEFAARIARIEAASAGKGKTTLYVGVDESYVFDRPTRRGPPGGLMAALQNAGYPLSVILSFALGAFAFCVGRYIRYQLSGMAETKTDPDVEMLIDLMVGVAIALLMGQLDRLKSYEQLIAKSLGVVFALLTFHNLVHMYPDEFSLLFSPLWVSKILATTEPHSILWRGISFVF
ncbi:MAG: hypothetical protein DI533_02290 [Cereibacter sphaeroides]|uniref:Uncharacterized protein n=1 Tax=Cereibacter sphaeroides TaxID=1063 RepID=A0A2W5S8Z9_CERSP|nr:MAG: hypothetical protein DI533_02290 [Cereibacter sphaeroides]